MGNFKARWDVTGCKFLIYKLRFDFFKSFFTLYQFPPRYMSILLFFILPFCVNWMSINKKVSHIIITLVLNHTRQFGIGNESQFSQWNIYLMHALQKNKEDEKNMCQTIIKCVFCYLLNIKFYLFYVCSVGEVYFNCWEIVNGHLIFKQFELLQLVDFSF